MNWHHFACNRCSATYAHPLTILILILSVPHVVPRSFMRSHNLNMTKLERRRHRQNEH